MSCFCFCAACKEQGVAQSLPGTSAATRGQRAHLRFFISSGLVKRAVLRSYEHSYVFHDRLVRSAMTSMDELLTGDGEDDFAVSCHEAAILTGLLSAALKIVN
jgi:hypothetical protein